MSTVRQKPSQRPGASLIRSEADRLTVQGWLAAHQVKAAEIGLQGFDRLVADIRENFFDWIVIPTRGFGLDEQQIKSLLNALQKSDTELWTADDDQCISDALIAILIDADHALLEMKSIEPFFETSENTPDDLVRKMYAMMKAKPPATAISSTSKSPRLTVDIESRTVTLDGDRYVLPEENILVLESIVSGEGHAVTRKVMQTRHELLSEDEHLDRKIDDLKDLCPKVFDLIERVHGKGYLIPKEYLE